MFKNKIDQFEEYDNKIQALNQQELEHLKEISNIREAKKKLEIERRDCGIRTYLEKEKRERILEQARQYGYSYEKLEELQNFVNTWNQDVVDNDIIDSFRMIEAFIEDNQAAYKKNIFYRVSKCFADRGGNSDEN